MVDTFEKKKNSWETCVILQSALPLAYSDVDKVYFFCLVIFLHFCCLYDNFKNPAKGGTIAFGRGHMIPNFPNIKRF